jgi:hypothetical protein
MGSRQSTRQGTQQDARRGAQRSCQTPPRRSPLKLTRRGRIVVRLGLVAAVLLAVVAVVLVGGGAAMAGRTSGPLPVQYRVVHAGETLWGIAGEVAPDADPRDTVARIIDLNELSGAQVRPGMRLAVPVPR